jgi:chitodextrinase
MKCTKKTNDMNVATLAAATTAATLAATSDTFSATSRPRAFSAEGEQMSDRSDEKRAKTTSKLQSLFLPPCW